MVLIETAKYTLTVNQLILAAVSLFAGIIIIFFLRMLLRRKRIINLFGIKNSKKILNFIYIIFAFFSIYACLLSLGINFKAFLNNTIISTPKVKIYYYHIFVFYLILAGTRVLIHVIEAYVNRKPATSQMERGRSRSIYLIIKYFIYVIAIALFFDSLGFNITIVIASLSALLVGLGLGIQHIFNDLISGFIILFDRSIKIGDVVEIKDELVGKVAKINIRTSIVITRDDVEVIIPNSKFTKENITNWTHNSAMSRFNIVIGVAYGSDVRLVEKLLIQAAKSHELISLKTAPPTVHFVNFGESSLDFRLMFYSEDNFRIERIKSDLRFEIDKLFRENNISIPFPQTDVHFHSEK
ncbi:MAG: mechanosensitive ion channel [Bacteroidales bacterium]|nr:mechanosensitive ion channel [Bacteroidales bacterium]